MGSEMCIRDSSSEDAGGGNKVLSAVHWSPPFEGTLKVPPEDIAPYYDAVRKFQWLLGEGPARRHEVLGAAAPSGRAADDSDLIEQFGEEPWHEWALTHRMEEGELMTFNQRRMLHGRRPFTSENGVRHFQGVYLNIDEVMSRLRVLEARHGESTTSGDLDLLPAGNGSPI